MFNLLTMNLFAFYKQLNNNNNSNYHYDHNDNIVHSGVHWFGHALRKDGSHSFRRVKDVEVTGHRCRGKPRKRWRPCVNLGHGDSVVDM